MKNIAFLLISAFLLGSCSLGDSGNGIQKIPTQEKPSLESINQPSPIPNPLTNE